MGDDPPWCGLCRCPPTVLWPAALAMTNTDISFTKRAAQELSRCFNGLTVRANKAAAAAAATTTTAVVANPISTCQPGGDTCHTLILHPRRRSAQQHKNRTREWLATLPHARTLTELWLEPAFLTRLFKHVPPKDRGILAQVCTAWREVAYQPKFWRGLQPVIRCRELRSSASSGVSRAVVYRSLERRGFDSLCLFGATDDDIYDLISHFPMSYAARIRQIGLRCSGVTDRGLEVLLGGLHSVTQLELSSCNEISDAGLWAGLTPRIVSLTLADCINVADETVAAITQLLPSLYELNLQAYHVTDASLSYFSPRQTSSLCVLKLRSCWELTNQGILNLIHSLPNLVQLSLSGCSKISDDGVELLAENLRNLRSLDLSWCPRITDASLEYIACDLTQLEELVLDRCVHVSDIGLGYLSTMNQLCSLYLRWCVQIRDYGIKHLCCMKSLQVLSLAGCHLVTASGLACLVQLRHLQELELTNCRGATKELLQYLHDNIPNCLIIE